MATGGGRRATRWKGGQLETTGKGSARAEDAKSWHGGKRATLDPEGSRNEAPNRVRDRALGRGRGWYDAE
ncbi:hypothetical protein ACRE_019550 [Hapsidospora chrysogenum ATCC 11550]|uniref:Uncharacterized protein n=1 Tax=Hapsidospora chrysogenum (strain ATCC 11550 / CBS 779.69 / DSM 880 / IAM 14645 / JCM 23072 / IMI 49137) TaxID=857340 RepID=A0A086TCU3_HAPC1|nr:hypothetical protein ACRE_019550 [Hapsidospora chrysogenum ATCC 11550]